MLIETRPVTLVRASDSVTIEVIHESHALPLFQLIDNNRDHLRPWFPWLDFMDSIEKMNAFIHSSLESYNQMKELPCVILYNNRLCGRIGIYNIDAGNHTGSIGYWLGKEFEENGIATLSSKAMISFGFDKLDLNRIEIRCGTLNLRSQKIPIRLGFKHEGVLEQAEQHGEKYIDLHLYSMLKENWHS